MIVKGIRTGTYVAEALSGKRAGLCPNLLEKLPRFSWFSDTIWLRIWFLTCQAGESVRARRKRLVPFPYGQLIE